MEPPKKNKWSKSDIIALAGVIATLIGSLAAMLVWLYPTDAHTSTPSVPPGVTPAPSGNVMDSRSGPSVPPSQNDGKARPFFFSDIVPVEVSPNPNARIGAIVPADLNNDGKLDLVAVDNSNSDQIWVLLGKGNGTFQPAVSYKVGHIPYGIVVADFNNDNFLDIAITNIGWTDRSEPTTGTISILLGKGDGTFEPARTIQAGLNPTQPVVEDFNGDNIPDLAVGSWTSDAISVYLGRGDGSFQDAKTFKASIQTASLGVGDFNSDGKRDLVVVNNRNSEVTILPGLGDGTFGEARSFPTQEERSHGAPWWGPYSVLVADFNEDGRPDLAVTNFSDHNIGILLGKGNGDFQMPRTFETDEGPFSMAIGDFNGDGREDLVSANNSGQVSVLLGNGDGTFQAKRSFPTGGSTTSIVVADFNGDGKPDLAVANRDKNFIGLMFNSIDATKTRLLVLGENPAPYGSEIAFKVVVTSSRGTPEGQVRFGAGDKIIGTAALEQGEARFSTSHLSAGSHNITAEYQGSDRYNASSASIAVAVR